jgi:hypothetical protein
MISPIVSKLRLAFTGFSFVTSIKVAYVLLFSLSSTLNSFLPKTISSVSTLTIVSQDSSLTHGIGEIPVRFNGIFSLLERMLIGSIYER